MTYEEAIKELEEILEELENEDLPLEVTLEKYKRGLYLYNYCNNKLKDIEGEVKILLKDQNGDLIEEDFNGEV